MRKQHSLVLDTHVWIWIVNGSDEIKPELRSEITKALTTGTVLIPAISVWEIGMLWRRNRIQLSKPADLWVNEALELTGFCLAPLSAAIALESTKLPGQFHSDPADCMIVATARLEDSVLVTRDRLIVDYGSAGHVRILCA